MMNAREIKLQSIGQWGGLVSNLAPQLSPAIEKTGKHIACPVHGGKDGFRVFKDFARTGGGICNTCGEFSDGLALLQWVNSWSFRVTLDEVNKCLSGSSQSTSKHTIKPMMKINDKPNDKSQKSIDRVLSQTTSIRGVVASYLNNRGLGKLGLHVPNDLKSVESLPYWHDGNNLGSFPAMVGVIRNLAGDVVSLHRTYLNTQGFKANVSAPKKLMSPAIQGATAGCAIQLFKPTKQLAITEGIETALAIYLSTGLPVWAAISTTMLEKVHIPASVEEVFIMADKDLSGAGARSASILASRLIKNHTVRVIEPSPSIPNGEKSIDWLDVYQRETGFNIKPLLMAGGTS